MSLSMISPKASIRPLWRRSMSTITQELTKPAVAEGAPATHFKITLTRSAIGLPQRYKATLESLGIHRRMQTVFMPHSGVAAGKILRVKELVEVENVRTDQVRTKKQQREDRKAPRGYVVVKSLGT